MKDLIKILSKSASGVIILYDIKNRNSFDEIDECMALPDKFKDNSSIILVGNKVDLVDKKVVLFEEGSKKAKDYGIKFMETRAKIRYHIDDLLIELVQDEIQTIKTTSLNGYLLNK